jgi:hypothetical protein
MKHLTLLSILLACDPAPVTSRDGSTGADEPDLSGCACDPWAAEPCKPGLTCAPVDGGHACLAGCSGLTTCPASCVYPFAGEKGTGPAYCPACLSCAPVDPLALTCQ